MIPGDSSKTMGFYHSKTRLHLRKMLGNFSMGKPLVSTIGFHHPIKTPGRRVPPSIARHRCQFSNDHSSNSGFTRTIGAHDGNAAPALPMCEGVILRLLVKERSLTASSLKFLHLRRLVHLDMEGTTVQLHS